MPMRCAVFVLCLVAGTPAFAQHTDAGHATPDMPGMQHHLGTVAFANSCSPAAQPDLLRGVAMLHSFWYSAGEQAFRDALLKDPRCAIADWGIAALMMNNPLAGIGATPSAATKAQAALDQAHSIGAPTQRERDYVDAVGAYYRDFAIHTERERQIARGAAYEALAAQYPNDDEAQIFDALYIAATQAQSDQTYSAYARAVAILEPMFRKYPDHPGVAHYLIHAYDAPPLAVRGMEAARAYSKIAPDAPHAQHMPSHIFTRVGAWEDSVTSNVRAIAAALPGHEFGEAQHASDYLVYAELQLSRDAAAKAAIDRAMAIEMPAPLAPSSFYARSAMPARYAVERGDWQSAAVLPVVAGGPPYTEALRRFARAIGAARTGNADAAAVEAKRLGALQEELTAAGNTYWAAEVEVERLAAVAWAAFARGETVPALAAMRDAADSEDRQEKHIVTPGRVLPARELLADMLMEAGQPAAALAEYEKSFQRDPNRFRGLYGAGRAAEAAGDQTKALDYAKRLTDLTRTGDTIRPEMAWARGIAH
jgi:tetratricopeptide (TPR) repeat protein